MNAEEKFNSLPIGSEISFPDMPGSYRVVELFVHSPLTRGVLGPDYKVRMIYEMCHVHSPWESEFSVLSDIEKGISVDRQWTAQEILDREA